MDTDLNTIEGVTSDTRAKLQDWVPESQKVVQNRFQGKKIFDDSGDFQSVSMQKGEGKDYSGDDHKVDGLSEPLLLPMV